MGAQRQVSDREHPAVPDRVGGQAVDQAMVAVSVPALVVPVVVLAGETMIDAVQGAAVRTVVPSATTVVAHRVRATSSRRSGVSNSMSR